MEYEGKLLFNIYTGEQCAMRETGIYSEWWQISNFEQPLYTIDGKYIGMLYCGSFESVDDIIEDHSESFNGD